MRESPSSFAQAAYPGGYDVALHPVQCVTWFGAARYCDWMSMVTGETRAYTDSDNWLCNSGNPYLADGYRLPTESEWEYSAQFSDGRIYPWGGSYPNCDLVNYFGKAWPICVGWTAPIGSRPQGASALGIMELAGNLREWCNDRGECDLGFEPLTNPCGSNIANERVVRGSSWFHSSGGRCCQRIFQDPAFTSYTGFRIVKTLSN